MVKLEKAFLDHDEYKFGVLYGKGGQSENEMFANGTINIIVYVIFIFIFI
jgi:hypothetical protein